MSVTNALAYQGERVKKFYKIGYQKKKHVWKHEEYKTKK
jgi:hypothetical protein